MKGLVGVEAPKYLIPRSYTKSNMETIPRPPSDEILRTLSKIGDVVSTPSQEPTSRPPQRSAPANRAKRTIPEAVIVPAIANGATVAKPTSPPASAGGNGQAKTKSPETKPKKPAEKSRNIESEYKTTKAQYSELKSAWLNAVDKKLEPDYEADSALKSKVHRIINMRMKKAVELENPFARGINANIARINSHANTGLSFSQALTIRECFHEARDALFEPDGKYRQPVKKNVDEPSLVQ